MTVTTDPVTAEPLTTALCATRAAAMLDMVTHAVSEGYASALIASAHAWMALGQLIADQPDVWSAPAGLGATNRMMLEFTADIEVTKAADLAAADPGIVSAE